MRGEHISHTDMYIYIYALLGQINKKVTSRHTTVVPLARTLLDRFSRIPNEESW